MSYLDFIFSPLLKYPPVYVIIGLSLGLSIMITFIYKWMTDQTLMKQLKQDIKKLQEQMKANKSNQKKLLEINKMAMEKNMQYMGKSMKPTLVTFIPLILIFGWVSAHYTYDPVSPGESFTMTATFREGSTGTAKLLATEGMEIIGNTEQEIKDSLAKWTLMGNLGNHLLEVEYDGQKFSKEIIITESYEFAAVSKVNKEEKLTSLSIEARKFRVFGEDFKIINYHPGWLGLYIITSIVFSMALRKLLDLS